MKYEYCLLTMITKNTKKLKGSDLKTSVSIEYITLVIIDNVLCFI